MSKITYQEINTRKSQVKYKPINILKCAEHLSTLLSLTLDSLNYLFFLQCAKIKGNKKDPVACLSWKNPVATCLEGDGRRKGARSDRRTSRAMYLYVYVYTYTCLKMACGRRSVILSHDSSCPNDGRVLGNYAPLNCWLLKDAVAGC